MQPNEEKSLDSQDYSLLLNQIAQGIYPMEEGLKALRESPEPRAFWQALRTMVMQSHPTKEEAYQAIEAARLRPTFTACVLIVKEAYPERRLGQICSLPEHEHEKSVRLLIHLFRIADKRRRETQCQDGCSHWWHQDLSPPTDP